MKTYEIAGVQYPLAFTLGAMDRVAELCGGVEKVAGAFDEKSVPEQTALLVELLRALLVGGRDNRRAYGEEGLEPPSAEMLKAALLPRDILPAKMAIFDAMTDGLRRTVEVEAPKNAEATRGEQRPRGCGTTRTGSGFPARRPAAP